MADARSKLAQIAVRTDDGRVFFDMAETGNPCFGCGCCCRHFRVSFYHGEVDTQPGGVVPADLTVPVTPFRVAMKGTEHGHGRCIAQQEDGRCGIYTRRPSVCREFPVFMEDGSMNPECIRLRELYGIDAPAQPAGDAGVAGSRESSEARRSGLLPAGQIHEQDSSCHAGGGEQKTWR